MICPVCHQPECPDSSEGARERPGSHATRLGPGQRQYRGYDDWAVHPDEARYVLHRGYALVNGEQRHVHFVRNEAFVTMLTVDGSGTEVNIYEGIP